MMTPGETGVSKMLKELSPERALLSFFCIAAYGALLIFTTCLPRVLPGVIIVPLLRSYIFYNTNLSVKIS